ncbi:NUDIX domain-containing protein [Nitratifractor sp.]
MKRSAGILPFRRKGKGFEIFLIHMGGPYWRSKLRSWSLVKGELEEGEEPLEAAKREFREETGQEIDGHFLDLGEVKSGSKVLHAWAVEAEPDTKIHSNTFKIEWPPGSGKNQELPEADRAAWVSPQEAKELLAKYQVPLVERLEKALSGIEN